MLWNDNFFQNVLFPQHAVAAGAAAGAAAAVASAAASAAASAVCIYLSAARDPPGRI